MGALAGAHGRDEQPVAYYHEMLLADDHRVFHAWPDASFTPILALPNTPRKAPSPVSEEKTSNTQIRVIIVPRKRAPFA